ncbi:TrbI/VirB10 family protein [Achromobacter aloeverae]
MANSNSSPSGTGQAKKLTGVPRQFIKIALIGFVSVMLGVVIIRQVTGTAPKSLQERQDEKLQHDREASAPADVNALRRTLMIQLEDQLKRNAKNGDTSPPQGTPDTQAGGTNKANTTPSPGGATHTLEDDAKRLAQLRDNSAQAAGDTSDFWSWEPQDIAGATPGSMGLAGVPPATQPDAMLAAAKAAALRVAGRADSDGSTLDANFATGNGNKNPSVGVGGMLGPGGTISSSQAAQNSATDMTGGMGTSGPLVPTRAPSPYWIREGWVIPAVIVQSLTTDAPGTFRAMVTSDVYDSILGRYLLIERGTMMLGAVKTDVQQGQTRMQMAVARMDFPNGAYIRLGNWNISDATGAAGLEADDVDDHFWAQYGAAFAVAGIEALAGHYDNNQNVTINVGGGGSPGAASSLSGAAGQSLSDTVKNILQKNRTYKRTLSLDPGDKINVVVAHDMLLPPELARSNQ